MKRDKLIVIFFVSFLFFLFNNQAFAQNILSLQECIDYALENSLDVKQKIFDKESKYIQLKATKTSIAPSLNGTVGQNFDFGRSRLPDNTDVSTTQSTTNFNVGLNMNLFQGLRTFHQIKSDKLNLEIALLDIESAKENIELMVTTNYLQVLLHKEILEVYKNQVIMDNEQLEQTSILITNGKKSDAELYAAQSSLANTQLSVVEATNTLRLSLLDLAQLINYSEVANFDIVSDNNLSIDELLNRNINVNHVIENAFLNRPIIKASVVRIEQAKRNIKMAQSGWYPSLIFSANFGTGYYFRFKDIANIPNESFGFQFKNNAKETLGATLAIPFFDKLSTHFNVKQQRINVKLQELQFEESKRKLVKDIEQAYANAVASKEKYLSTQIANKAAQKAFQYEEIKYKEGASTYYEFNDLKNKYLKTQSDLIQAKFDFLFRMKILEFYGKY